MLMKNFFRLGCTNLIKLNIDRGTIQRNEEKGKLNLSDIEKIPVATPLSIRQTI